MGLALVKDLPTVIPEWISALIRRLHGTFFPEGSGRGGGREIARAPVLAKKLPLEILPCSVRLQREWYAAKAHMRLEESCFKFRDSEGVPPRPSRFQKTLILGVPLSPISGTDVEDEDGDSAREVERSMDHDEGEGVGRRGRGRRRVRGLDCDLVVGTPCLEVVYGSFSRKGATHDNEDRLSVAYWGGSKSRTSTQRPGEAFEERREEPVRTGGRTSVPASTLEAARADTMGAASRLSVQQAGETSALQGKKVGRASASPSATIEAYRSIESPAREEQAGDFKREAADGGTEKQGPGAASPEEAASAAGEQGGSSWSTETGNAVPAGVHSFAPRAAEGQPLVQSEDQPKEGFQESFSSEDSDLEGGSGATSSTNTGGASGLAQRAYAADDEDADEESAVMLRLASVTPGYKLEEEAHLSALQKDRQKQTGLSKRQEGAAEEAEKKKRPVADMEESPCFMTPQGYMLLQKLPAKRAGDDLLLEMPFVAAKRTRPCHQAALTTSGFWHDNGKKKVQGWGYTAFPCPEARASKNGVRLSPEEGKGVQNWRGRSLLKDPFDHDDPTFVFTLCDGHDGPTAAVFAALELPKLLAGQGDSAAHASREDRNTGGLMGMKKTTAELGADNKKSSKGMQGGRNEEEARDQRLKDVFHDLDQRFRRECKQIAAETGRSCTSGACVISVVVRGDEVICQNVGDCKAAMITIDLECGGHLLSGGLRFCNPMPADQVVEVRGIPGPSDLDDLSSVPSTEQSEAEEEEEDSKEAVGSDSPRKVKRDGVLQAAATQEGFALPDLRRGLTKLDLPCEAPGQSTEDSHADNEDGRDDIPGEWLVSAGSSSTEKVSRRQEASDTGSPGGVPASAQVPADGLPPSVARAPSASPSVKWLSEDRKVRRAGRTDSSPENKTQGVTRQEGADKKGTLKQKKQGKKSRKDKSKAAPERSPNKKPLVLQWLNFEQRCTEQREIERLRKAGGVLIGGRMGGVLEPSRTIGDFDVKDVQPEGALSTEPEVTRVRVRKPSLMLIATDGVWDCVTMADIFEALQKVQPFWDTLLEAFSEANDDPDEDIYEGATEASGGSVSGGMKRRPEPRVRHRFNQTVKADVLSRICEELVTVARKRGSEDDATCMAIFLNPAAPPAGEQGRQGGAPQAAPGLR